MDNKKELIEYIEKIQTFDKDSAQDATVLHAYLVELTNIMARSNLLMAEYKREFRKNKKDAYLKLTASSHSQQQYFAPTLAKDFIDAQCGEIGYMFDLAERCSRLCTHTIDAIRTIVSSLKSERQFANY